MCARRFLLPLFGCLLLCQSVAAQEYTFGCEARFAADTLTQKMAPIKRFCGSWRLLNEGSTKERFRVPFLTDEYERLELEKEFFLEAIPEDTLFLYFERMAFVGEIYVNGALVKLVREPLSPQLVPLPPALNMLNRQWNRIRVVLRPSDAGNLLQPPPDRIGLYRPAYLLHRVDSIPRTPMPRFVQQADEAVIYPVYDTAFGYNQLERHLRADLRNLRQRGVRTLYCPMGLPNKLYPLLHRLEFQLLTEPNADQWAIYRPYPLASRAQFLPIWYLGERPAPEWGVMTALQPTLGFSYPKLFLIVGSVAALMMVAMWRQLDPSGFQQILTGFFIFSATRPARTSDKSVLAGSTVLYLLLLRLLLMSFSLTLFFQYLGAENALGLLNVFRHPSALFQLEQWSEANPWRTGGLLLALLAGVLLLKVLLLGLLARIYQIRGLVQRLLEYMVIGSYPGLLMITFASLLPFAEAQLGLTATVIIWLLAFILSGLYYIWSLVTALNQFPRILPIGKFLYICVIELLPLVLLL